MLVQFVVKNVLSFKEETILDMRAINAYNEHQSNLIDIGRKDKYLKVASIYGANASGKSNLMLAMFYFQSIVRDSLNTVKDGESSTLEGNFFPFLFDGKIDNSEFEVTEIFDDNEFRYGFEYNADCIVAEWLYRKNFKTNRVTTIFERSMDHVEFGASVRNACEVYRDQIPGETLVLTFLNRLKIKKETFSAVYSNIMDTFVTEADFWDDDSMQREFLPGIIDESKDKLVEFLGCIDTGIKDISYEKIDDKIRIYTTHTGKNGKDYTLGLYNESDGTLKSILLYILARVAILNDKSLFIDELNDRLHPLLLKYIIDLFYESDSMAQLIYTTHDTTLMDKKFFRRDQIWFVQKDEYGYSELVALSDYKVRSDASFEKDYLAGVYGGIPFLKEFQMKEK